MRWPTEPHLQETGPSGPIGTALDWLVDAIVFPFEEATAWVRRRLGIPTMTVTQDPPGQWAIVHVRLYQRCDGRPMLNAILCRDHDGHLWPAKTIDIPIEEPVLPEYRMCKVARQHGVHPARSDDSHDLETVVPDATARQGGAPSWGPSRYPLSAPTDRNTAR